MSSSWIRRHVSDPFVKLSQKEGYRARSAFKLQSLQESHRFLRANSRVVDLGCSPGSWAQVVLRVTRGTAQVVGVDLAPTEPVPGAVFLRGDFLKTSVFHEVRSLLRGGRADVVLCDAAAEVSGNPVLDDGRALRLLRGALSYSQLLRPNHGVMVIKVRGGVAQAIRGDAERLFSRVEMVKPRASRAESSESYVVATRRVVFEGEHEDQGPPEINDDDKKET